MLKDHFPLSPIQFLNTAETWLQTVRIAIKLRYQCTLIVSPYLERFFPLYDESESYFFNYTTSFDETFSEFFRCVSHIRSH